MSGYYEQELRKLEWTLDGLRDETAAIAAVLLDGEGRLLVASGPAARFASDSLAGMVGADAAGANAQAQLAETGELSALSHDGERESVHFKIIGARLLLAIWFDEKSSLGLVRLRLRQRLPDLEALVGSMLQRWRAGGPQPFADIDLLDALRSG